MKKSIICIGLLLSGILCIFLAQKINLPATDIGRHIKNGEILLHANTYNTSRSALLHTNFFSYTNPDFPFVNHHWGYGIIAYLTYTLFGWTGLSLAYICVLTSAFLILFLLIAPKTPLYTSIPISLFLIPLIAERTEIRPEGISYLFIAIFLYILTKYSHDELEKKHLLGAQQGHAGQNDAIQHQPGAINLLSEMDVEVTQADAEHHGGGEKRDECPV
mgnify:CR=1 FL=1